MDELWFFVEQVFDVTRLDKPNISQNEPYLSKPGSVLVWVSIFISPMIIMLSYLSNAQFKDLNRSEKNVSRLELGGRLTL